MAEGWMRHYAKKKSLAFEIHSAGMQAHGLNANAVRVMAEVFIDISKQESKTLDQIDFDHFELLVTVCGEADEQCPVLGAGMRKIHWPLADPAKIRGTEDEILQGFRHTRDEIRTLIVGLLDTFP